MLSHPLRVRSMCRASRLKPEQIEKKFLSVARFAAENEKPAGTAGLRRTLPLLENLERAKGFEPSTPTLARSCSTPELHPHPRDWRRSLAGNGQSYAKCAPRMQQPARGPLDARMARYRRYRAEIVSKSAPTAVSRPLLRLPAETPGADCPGCCAAIRGIRRTSRKASRSVHRDGWGRSRRSPTIRRRPDRHPRSA
jgi:hypothetical protein